jgi:type II secretory pathway pseudopilin PulG
MVAMRAFSTLELLVVVAMISLLVSMTLYFRWDDTKKELEDSQDIQNATTELWLIRIDDPTQPVYWVWEDENGVMWMLSRSDNSVRRVGP